MAKPNLKGKAVRNVSQQFKLQLRIKEPTYIRYFPVP